MSRKDYILFADFLCQAYDAGQINYEKKMDFAKNLCRKLYSDNSRFNQKTFLSYLKEHTNGRFC